MTQPSSEVSADLAADGFTAVYISGIIIVGIGIPLLLYSDRLIAATELASGSVIGGLGIALIGICLWKVTSIVTWPVLE